MANKRMFDKRVIDNDSFLEMPLTTQAVYFHLNMRADDDGFVDNWKSILRTVGGKEDDIKVLITKKFIIPFEKGVIVIRHWRLNNYLQNDRTKPTIYQEEKKKLLLDKNGVYSLYPNCIRSIDKNRLEEISIEENSTSSTSKELVTITNSTKNDDVNKKNIFELVEQAFGRPLSPVEFEEINSWTDNDLTRHAIRIAELNRATKISYIVTILRNYERNGIRSTTEAEEFDKKFQGRKNTCTVSNSSIPKGHKLGDIIGKNGHTYLVTKDGEVLYDK